jgi:hypothetical protein
MEGAGGERFAFPQPSPGRAARHCLIAPAGSACGFRVFYEAFDSATILDGIAGVLSMYPTPRTV